MSINKQLYFDKLGLICSRHTSGVDEIGRPITADKPWLDGGDSANRTLAYYIGEKLNGRNIQPSVVRQALNYLQCPDSKGNYRRHPDPLFWYSEDDRMSRDQSIPVVVAMGLFGLNDMLKDFYNAHKKRGLLFTTNTRRNGHTKENHGIKYYSNARDLRWYEKLALKYRIPLIPTPKGYRNYSWKLPDLTLFEFHALYIRGFRKTGLLAKAYLHLADLFLVFSALFRSHSEDEDVINHSIQSAYAAKIMPTVFSRLANDINQADDLSNKMKRFYDHPRLPSFLSTVWKSVCNKYFS